MSMDIVSRLRCVLKGDKAAQAGADEIERLRAELAHYKEAATKLSAETYDLEAELSASREREARMRCALRNLLALDVDHQRGADDEDVCAEVREARAVLAEGAQG